MNESINKIKKMKQFFKDVKNGVGYNELEEEFEKIKLIPKKIRTYNYYVTRGIKEDIIPLDLGVKILMYDFLGLSLFHVVTFSDGFTKNKTFIFKLYRKATSENVDNFFYFIEDHLKYMFSSLLGDDYLNQNVIKKYPEYFINNPVIINEVLVSREDLF